MHAGLSLHNAAFVGALRAPFVAGSIAFDFTSNTAIQSWTVPPGASTVTAKAWGSAGGSNTGQLGGYGSFVAGTFYVSAGQTIAVKIGWSGGTGGCVGGGYSAVEYPSGLPSEASSWLVAGGGGGAGLRGSIAFEPRGGDGGLSGVSGQNSSPSSRGGTGALTGAPGGGGYGSVPGSGGALLMGGNGSMDLGWVGGGGGGGYFGGGGGGTFLSNHAAGGGGGSSIVSGCFSVANTGLNFSDPDWNGLAGFSGNQGRVILFYS